jgi:1,4-dihydroxy-2-naphthoate octaprenyltransferase
MAINFGMWKKSLSELVKMESKDEWNKLDTVSKWLIATRSAVTIVTLYSCAIGGLLAIRYGYFTGHWGISIIVWLIVTMGLYLAHGTNNLLNDYTDYSRGIDNDNYFRTQYGVHPLNQGFWSKRQQLNWFAVSGFLAMLRVFLLFFTLTSRLKSLHFSHSALLSYSSIHGQLSTSHWVNSAFS